MWSPIPLVVFAPDHGKEVYLWERKRSHNDIREVVKVLSSTCVLHVDTTVQYRCIVNDQSIVYNVKGTNFFTNQLIIMNAFHQKNIYKKENFIWYVCAYIFLINCLHYNTADFLIDPGEIVYKK